MTSVDYDHERIRRERAARRWSQQEMAHRIGLKTRVPLSKAETGTFASEATLRGIAMALELADWKELLRR